MVDEQQRLGRYELLAEIGRGAMGVVYKARDPIIDRVLAIKTVDFRGLGEVQADVQGRFFEEAQSAGRLNHPNIVSVFDFDSDRGLDFIVMEWLEGQTLADLLSQITSKRIALHKAYEVVRGVASALTHAHELGVVHGDVKPSNIFLTSNRSVKLLDFGSSVQASADADSEGNWATRAYASCEVLQGASPQPNDDVFALGVTAYRLMSGDRPFGDLDAAEARATGSVASPLPPDAERSWPAIEHALQFNALDRPAHAGEFLAEFIDPPIESTGPVDRSQLEHIAYGAVAVALLIALVAWTVGSTGGGAVDEQGVLERAEIAFSDGRLTEPAENNAFELYSAVLQISPEHPAANAGLQRIAEHYLATARRALADDDPRGAAELLATARQVMPDHYGIPIMNDLIGRYGKDLLFRAREAAATDLDEAERLLAHASAFIPANDPAVTAVDAQLERMRENASRRSATSADRPNSSPVKVARTASSSPIASRDSPGSAPKSPSSAVKRYQGIVSCIRAR